MKDFECGIMNLHYPLWWLLGMHIFSDKRIITLSIAKLFNAFVLVGSG